MRVFICLSIFCFMLATCQGKCFSDPLRSPLKHGKVVKPRICVDRYDVKTHPIGSGWDTAHCFVCVCTRAGLRCCQRSNETVIVERCKKGENPESCKDVEAGIDDKCQDIFLVDEENAEIIREVEDSEFIFENDDD